MIRVLSDALSNCPAGYSLTFDTGKGSMPLFLCPGGEGET